MSHSVLVVFLALSLNSEPPPGASVTKRRPPPATEKPQPPPPPPPSKPAERDDEPEPERPRRPVPYEETFNLDDDVLPVIRSHELAIQGCYSRTRTGTAPHKAEVIVEFDIDSNGRVLRERIAESRMASPELERCILEQVQRWSFRRQASFSAPAFHVRHTFSFQTL
jgi:TonB family protein